MTNLGWLDLKISKWNGVKQTMDVCCFCRYYGGWTAPDIYFLGFAGVVKFGNIRIGGLSGIYKAHDYHLGWLTFMDFNKAM